MEMLNVQLRRCGPTIWKGKCGPQGCSGKLRAMMELFSNAILFFGYPLFILAKQLHRRCALLFSRVIRYSFLLQMEPERFEASSSFLQRVPVRKGRGFRNDNRFVYWWFLNARELIDLSCCIYHLLHLILAMFFCIALLLRFISPAYFYCCFFSALFHLMYSHFLWFIWRSFSEG